MTVTADIDAVVAALRSHERLLVTSHENPDGDALGSLLAMHLALTQLGKDSAMVLEGPAPLPGEYRFLGLESRGLLRLSEAALRESLGAAIRERRKALGLTLAQMAERTSVSLGYLSQIELGKNSASIETLYRISLGLRVRVADLFQAIQSQT